MTEYTIPDFGNQLLLIPMDDTYPQTVLQWTETNGQTYRLQINPRDGSTHWDILRDVKLDGEWKRLRGIETDGQPTLTIQKNNSTDNSGEDALRELVETWHRQQERYPSTVGGEHAASAVRCCAEELEEVLEEIYE